MSDFLLSLRPHSALEQGTSKEGLTSHRFLYYLWSSTPFAVYGHVTRVTSNDVAKRSPTALDFRPMTLSIVFPAKDIQVSLNVFDVIRLTSDLL